MWKLAILLLADPGMIQPPPRNSAPAGVSAPGTCTTDPSGAVICFDNTGARAGFPLTDAAPSNIILRGYAGSPIGSTAGNRTGGSIKLCGGVGARRGAVTQANCSAGTDTITITIDGGTPIVLTAHASATTSTTFACGASDAALATNIAAAFVLNTGSGMSACAGAGCTLFTGVAGTYYLWPTTGACEVTHVTNDATMDSITNGADGQVQFAWGTLALPSITWVGDTDAGIYRVVANTTGTAQMLSARGVTTGNAFTAGSSGTAFLTVGADTTPRISVAAATDVALGQTNLTVSHTESITFCGNGPNGATPTFIPPRIAGFYADATCDGFDNTTETSADAVWAPYDFTVVAMECGCSDVAVDTGLTFSFRDDAATPSTDLECTTGAGDASGFVSCADADTTPPVVAAGSLIDMRIVAASGNFSTADCWCRATVSY